MLRNVNRLARKAHNALRVLHFCCVTRFHWKQWVSESSCVVVIFCLKTPLGSRERTAFCQDTGRDPVLKHSNYLCRAPFNLFCRNKFGSITFALSSLHQGPFWCYWYRLQVVLMLLLCWDYPEIAALSCLSVPPFTVYSKPLIFHIESRNTLQLCDLPGTRDGNSLGQDMPCASCLSGHSTALSWPLIASEEWAASCCLCGQVLHSLLTPKLPFNQTELFF